MLLMVVCLALLFQEGVPVIEAQDAEVGDADDYGVSICLLYTSDAADE